MNWGKILIGVVILSLLLPVFSIALQDYNKDGIVDIKDTVLEYNAHIISGDTNRDTKVDIFDLTLIGKYFGTERTEEFSGAKTLAVSEYNSEADLNNDSKIDIFDLALVGRNYGVVPLTTTTTKTNVSINPSSLEVYKDSKFAISVDITTDVGILATAGDITFDSSILQVDSITAGGFLKKDGKQVYCPDPVINNSIGVIRFALDCTRMTSSTVTGTGNLAVINFTAAAKGTSSISINNGKLLDIDVSEIQGVNFLDSLIDVVTNKPPVIDSFYPATNPVINENQSQKFNVSSHDPEADPITYVWYLDNTNVGTASTYTYVSNYNSAGIHNITIIVSDNKGNSATKTWSLTVNNVNRIPTMPGTNSLTPTTAYKNTVFSCNASGSIDADEDSLTYYYEFRKSGATLQAYSTSNSYTCDTNCNKNDAVTCYAKAYDSMNYSSEKASNSVTIKNSIPTTPTTAVLAPSIAYKNSVFNCSASGSSDADGDSLTYYYEFRKSGATLKTYSTSNSYSCGTGCNKNDAVTCYAKAYDATNYSAEKASNSVTILNTIPTTPSVKIAPAAPKITDNLLCNATGSTDADNDAITYVYSWYKNSVLQGITGNLVMAGNLSKDDIWNCSVKAFDGQANSPAASDAVSVGNTPPVASNLVLSPANPKTTDALTASYTYSDIDNEPENGSEIRWYKNGIVQNTYDNLKVLPASTAKKGEKWAFSVKPSDGKSFGSIVYSSNVTILNSIPTTPTTAVLAPSIAYKNSVFNCSASGSSDADGDSLTYYYEFRKSGATLQAYSTSNSYTCETGCNKNDAVTCYAKAYDATNYSAEKASNSVTILNSAPVLGLIGNKTGEENVLLEITLSATDADSDALVYSASALPSGSSLTGNKFSWTPGFGQAGNYSVTFNASDGQANVGEKITIRVVKVNRAPVINSYLPLTNPAINEGTSQVFSVNASDPDGDAVIITWYLDNVQAGTGKTYTFNANYDSQRSYNMKAVVSDGQKTANQSWTLTVNDNMVKINLPAGKSIFSLARNQEVKFNELDTNCQLVNMNICPKPITYYQPTDDLNASNHVCLDTNDILYPGQGYFINVQNACYVIFDGDDINQADIGYLGSKQLKTGWNLIGSTSNEEVFNSGTCQLYSDGGPVKVIYGITSCTGVRYYDGRYQDCKTEFGTSNCGCSVSTLEPGFGYWLRTKNICSL